MWEIPVELDVGKVAVVDRRELLLPPRDVLGEREGVLRKRKRKEGKRGKMNILSLYSFSWPLVFGGR